jgi:hypothetical protein
LLAAMLEGLMDSMTVNLLGSKMALMLDCELETM